MNHRTRRLLGALSVTSILFGLALAGPVTAKAAPLTVSFANLSPSVVSQGQLGAFEFTATNSGTTANIAQLYLTEKSGAGVYAVTGDRAEDCSTSGQLLCSFGALNPGDSIHLKVALVAPAGSSWDADFEFSSNGYVLGGNKSHGDLWTQVFHISTPGSADDAAGTYVWDASHQSIHNGLSLGNNNKQSTSVTVSGTSFPASLADGTTLTFTCGSGFNCPGTFFGQVSQVDVDNGANHTIHVVIQLYKPGKNPNNVNGVYHQYVDSNNVLQEEFITTVCDSASAPSTVPCFLATRLSGNNLQLDVWAPHNGKYGGF